MADVFAKPKGAKIEPASVFGDRLKPLNVFELERVRACVIRVQQANAADDPILALRYSKLAFKVIEEVEAQVASGARRAAAKQAIIRPGMDRRAIDCAHPEAYDWADGEVEKPDA